jgi:Na+-transporting methylmalonyl-CoA/oxaloacetate decarboxylase gamma subunit
MDKWTFGITMMIVGVGGTFLTLWILGAVVGVLKRVFPLGREDGPKKEA